MPAIVDARDFCRLARRRRRRRRRALALLKPAPEPALELVEIGPSVNRVANDDPGVQTPVAEPIRAAERLTLF